MIDRFIEYLRVERRYSVHTQQAYERDLKEFCSFLNIPSDVFDPQQAGEADVRAWMVAMLDNGLSPRSVNRKLSSLRSFYKFLLKLGLVKIDITHIVNGPKTDKPLPVFFNESDMQKVAATMSYADDFESVRDNIVIEMLYETGMRRAEIIGLKDGDIDFQQSQIRVFGKRRKERIVPFGLHLRQEIERYLAFREEKFGIICSPEQVFLLNNKGMTATPSFIYTLVRARMGEVSKQKRSPHVLRHTFATTMLNNGADINTIKTLLGHASLSATQVYTHITFQQLKEAYEKAHPREKNSHKKQE